MNDTDSRTFANNHTRTLFGDAPKLKISKDKFKDNSYYAHLIGRAFACELILERHRHNPYDDVDILLGDLQIELTECMNKFRNKAAYHTIDKFKVEQFI